MCLCVFFMFICSLLTQFLSIVFVCIVSVRLRVLFNGPLWSDLNKGDDDDNDMSQ